MGEQNESDLFTRETVEFSRLVVKLDACHVH